MTEEISPEADLDEARAKLLRAKLGSLLRWRLPVLTDTIGPSDPSIFIVFGKRRLHMVNSCVAFLRSLTDDEVGQIISRTNDPDGPARRWRAFLDDEIDRLKRAIPPWYAGGFGHPDHIANFDYWARQSFFSIEELNCVSVGFDPREDIGKSIKRLRPDDQDMQYPAVRFLIERHELLTRQFDPNGYERRVRPADFLRWVDRMEIEVHPDFLTLLRRFHSPDQQKPKSRPLPKQDRREIDTIAQLFTAMAIDHFGYDPRSARSTVPREIAELASEMGLSVSDDTVRKFLRLGASFIPDDWEPHNG